jgi:hypothetical protein
MVATVFAGLLFLGLLYNFIFNPTEKRLAEVEKTEYSNPSTSR